MREQKTTQHTCCPPGRGPGFIRTPGCPRCEELLAGAAPRQQSWRKRETRAQEDARRCAEIHEHFASARHNDRNHPLWCGPVCTFGEW